jgi:hypothetical protein
MHRAWVDVAAGGDPGWPAYDLGRRPVMRFGERSGVEDDPDGDVVALSLMLSSVRAWLSLAHGPQRRWSDLGGAANVALPVAERHHLFRERASRVASVAQTDAGVLDARLEGVEGDQLPLAGLPLAAEVGARSCEVPAPATGDPGDLPSRPRASRSRTPSSVSLGRDPGVTAENSVSIGNPAPWAKPAPLRPQETGTSNERAWVPSRDHRYASWSPVARPGLL